MKPVNFIKKKSKKNNLNIRITLLIPIILVATFLLVDYISIVTEIKEGKENYIEVKEVLNLELEINELKQNNNDLMKKKDFLTSLNNSNVSSENLINIISYTRELEDDNTFITSIYFDEFIKISGHSRDENSIVKFLNNLNEIYDVFSLEEIKFSNGYYTFDIGEVSK